MLFSKRHYLGLDISATALQAVCLTGSNRNRQLTAARGRDLTNGLVTPHLREQNLPVPNELIAGIQDLLAPLAMGEERVSLSIPDRSGRLLVHEMETMFKTREEGLDILRWQLKDALPASAKEVQLDFQVLAKHENGRHRLLVSAVNRQVLGEYEQLLNAAGFHPVVIDFHSLNVMNSYRSQFDANEDLVLIQVDSRTLVFQYYQNGVLTLHRYRDVGENINRVFQEVNRSVAGNRDRLPNLSRAKLYLQSDWVEVEGLVKAVSSVFDRPVILLEPKLERLTVGKEKIPSQQARCLAGALGAAGRLI